jgi:hypothetical protein
MSGTGVGITRVGYDRILIVELKGSQWRTVTHNFQMKLFTQKLEMSAKIHVYSYRGLTDVSLVVLGHSLGVVGQ